ncbi:hypothetical protein PoB_003783200 [Plakobranchus ocellatus]|uniref:Uncharacterized protein n=1 Tax=Plakobranchus ocellatus TaxID=259542 RepID=A0AAV4AWL8_9GAST|nr:hypothetical protein PoB_003783200 [Plakobranchus ocellatus]
MSLIVDAATISAQDLRERVTKPFRMPTVERQGGVDRDQLIKLHQNDLVVKGFVGAEKTVQRGNETAFFGKMKDIAYRRFNDPGGNIGLKQVVSTKAIARIPHVGGPRFHYRSAPRDHAKKGHDPCNFYFLGVDGDMTR